MLFMMHTSMALQLMALVAGMLLLYKVCNAEVCCKGFYKVVAYVVIIISMLSIVCVGYHGIKMAAKGGMGGCPMMMGKMGEGMGMGGMMGPGMGPMHRGMMPPMEPATPPAETPKP